MQKTKQLASLFPLTDLQTRGYPEMGNCEIPWSLFSSSYIQDDDDDFSVYVAVFLKAVENVNTAVLWRLQPNQTTKYHVHPFTM